MKRKYLYTLFLTFVMVISFISPISAEVVDQTDNIIEELRKYNVADKNIDVLMWKYENGVAWDSLSDEFRDIKPQEVLHIGNYTQEITRYPDGSISISDTNLGTKVPFHKITPASIGGGDFDHGSTGRWWIYTGATVKQNTILIKASFKIDYSGNQTSIGQISSVYDYDITVYGGSSSFESLSITNKYASSNKPATAELRFTHTMVGGGYSKTAYLRANIQDRTNVYSTYSY